jgi:Kef-type K+ transport system membrane component KefB/voltage-gated potassium channel Kch
LESVAHYKDILLVLGTAGIIVPLLMRWGVSSILGYLIVGILLGPDVIGALAGRLPFLDAIAFSRNADFGSLAELGVVFLLFLIGLELSLERLNTMKRLVFGLGGLQVIISILIISAAAIYWGYGSRQAVILGMALSLSSTAIVIQLLSEQKKLGSQTGRVSFSILLMQDLAVIPMLMLLGLMTADTNENLAIGIAQALAQALAAIAVIIVVGRYALRPLLKMVASAQSTDLFMAAVLFITIGTGAVALQAGLSMSLGAFIAGLMLAETEYRRAIEAIIEPFKGILLGAFFLLVGLGLDLQALIEKPGMIIGTALTLVALKSFLVYGLARFYKVQRMAAIETALLLGPCGEFAFVLVAAAVASGAMVQGTQTTPLLIVTLSMMLIPMLSKTASWLRPRLARKVQSANFEAPPGELSGHVIVAGFGRVGTLIASMLDEHKIKYVAVDGDAAIVARERKNAMPVYFGDATSIEFLRKCGLANARALAITMDNPVRADNIVKVARAANPDLKIIARARDERHAMQLYLDGATEAVPETIESSLQLGEALLVEAGVPMGLAIASIHERRDAFRKLLGRPNRRQQVKSARARLKKRMP